jgi:hypothetical protein
MHFQEFRKLRFQPEGPYLDRDIIEHLDFLESFASKCDHITEFGVNNAHSTAAFLSGCKGKVVSYDIVMTQSMKELASIEDIPCKWEVHLHDTGDPLLEIEETDFLFIDSKHTYDHLKKELSTHPVRVHRYIGFHDTVSHGEVSNDGGYNLKGIMPAIREFLELNPQWTIKHEFTHNNGLLICERRQGLK